MQAVEESCDPSGSLIIAQDQVVRLETSQDFVADCDIVIHGSILADPGSSASVVLIAGGDITVTGTILAGSGRDGRTAESAGEAAIGGDGADGGWIAIIVTGQGSQVAIMPGALVGAGDGGKGGDAHVWGPVREPDACRCAYGGAGGDGGTIVIRGPAIVAKGALVSSKASDGGAAWVAAPGKSWSGAGGNAGMVLVEAASAEYILASNALALPGIGGDAVTVPMSYDCMGVEIYGCPGEHTADSCDAEAFAFILAGLVLDQINGGRGGSGGGNLDAEAYGGPGGDGIWEGGKGGTATSDACPNPGKAPKGDDGGDTYCTHWTTDARSGIRSCDEWSDPIDGEPGQRGTYVVGGKAYSKGGEGGTGFMKGGEGGEADATGGTGGEGGNGGDGGDGGICQSGSDGGNGGKGGNGGRADALGGDGGDARLILGTPGGGGVARGVRGEGGAGGLGGKGGTPGGTFWIGQYVGFGCNPQRGNDGDPGSLGDEGGLYTNHGDGGDSGYLGVDALIEELIGSEAGVLCHHLGEDFPILCSPWTAP